MRRYRKWVLTLGIMVVTPGLTQAGINPFAKSDNGRTANSAELKSTNQQVANDIAKALRGANLKGYDVEIEYRDGVVTLTGGVQDPSQKAKASHVASRVPGVERVDNRMRVLGQPVENPFAGRGGVQTAGLQQRATGSKSLLRRIGFTEGEDSAVTPTSGSSAAPSNQQVAENIAAALSAAKLSGYDIEIRFNDGVASLGGEVKAPGQKALASQVVQSVPGVRAVDNRLQVAGQSSAGPRPGQNPYARSSGAPIMPTGHYQGGQAGPAAMNYAHGGPGGNPAVFNQPHVPDNAWPSYAEYPNYAAVTYPKEYSASAWPYIGPFYPYPQVPLGWREAQLEWDDGFWRLNFRPRTSRWYWFLNPKNW